MWANVQLQLHMQGTEGGQVFTDVKGHTGTVSGTAKTTAAQSKWGATSGYFDGSGTKVGYTGLTTIGTGDFSIALWLYHPEVGGTYQAVMSTRINTDQDNPIYFDFGVTNANAIFWYSAAFMYQGASHQVPAGWNYIEVNRISGQTKISLNGNVVTTFADNHNYNTSSVSIGAFNVGTSDPFNGYIGELQLVAGKARHAGNFIPPSGPLPDS